MVISATKTADQITGEGVEPKVAKAISARMPDQGTMLFFADSSDLASNKNANANNISASSTIKSAALNDEDINDDDNSAFGKGKGGKLSATNDRKVKTGCVKKANGNRAKVSKAEKKAEKDLADTIYEQKKPEYLETLKKIGVFEKKVAMAAIAAKTPKKTPLSKQVDSVIVESESEMWARLHALTPDVTEKIGRGRPGAPTKEAIDHKYKKKHEVALRAVVFVLKLHRLEGFSERTKEQINEEVAISVGDAHENALEEAGF